MPKAQSPQKRRRTTTVNVTSSAADFVSYLRQSTRIMALCGAGLSASSGLPTFRDKDGLWRKHHFLDLATPSAFRENPGLVSQFYSLRQKAALKAEPNEAHLALAKLANCKDFITVTQNVDGLSRRAGHPEDKIFYIHGNLFDVQCGSESCKYFRPFNSDHSITNALAVPEDEETPLPDISLGDLPQCPNCSELLRPGVVWFYESLPERHVKAIEDWMDRGTIDLFLLIGTSSSVDPAAEYSKMARNKGARIAVFNTDREHVPVGGMRKKDWFFVGDAAKRVPELLKEVIDGTIDTLQVQER
jgi:NAD-dependent deacetylase sirtuin 5